MKARNRLTRAFTVSMWWLRGVRFERRPTISAKCGVRASFAIRPQVTNPPVQSTASGAVTGRRAPQIAAWPASLARVGDGL